MNIPFSRIGLGYFHTFSGDYMPDMGEEDEAVSQVLHSGWLAAGEQTKQFELEFGQYIGEQSDDGLATVMPHCIFTNSCTSALKIAYKWALAQGRTHLLYPENTFCATYSAAAEMGMKIVPYKEIDLETIQRVDGKTFGDDEGHYTLVSMHYGGVRHDGGEPEIEDSAHRIEANDPMVGKIRTYSFYATKNMTTGSGGMFVTYDKEIADFARLQWKDGLSSSTHDRQTGKSWNYKVEAMAGGYDGNDIAAAMGRVQLKKLPAFTRARNRIVQHYNEALGQDWQGNHLYPFMLRSLEEVPKFIEYMKDRCIATGYHYPGTGWLGVSLPLFPSLTEDEQQYIIDAVINYKRSNNYPA